MIMVQETMSVSNNFFTYFQICLYMVVVDSCGKWGGIVVLWDPRWTSLCAYNFLAAILLRRHIRGLLERIHFLNLYAPYKEKTSLWGRMKAYDILKIGSLIMAGDYNATLSREECWGLDVEGILWPTVYNSFLILIT